MQSNLNNYLSWSSTYFTNPLQFSCRNQEIKEFRTVKRHEKTSTISCLCIIGWPSHAQSNHFLFPLHIFFECNPGVWNKLTSLHQELFWKKMVITSGTLIVLSISDFLFSFLHGIIKIDFWSCGDFILDRF